MTIDPTKPERYRLRNGCEVVAIYPRERAEYTMAMIELGDALDALAEKEAGQ